MIGIFLCVGQLRQGHYRFFPNSSPRDHDVWTQRDFIHQSDVVVELPESKTFASLEDSQPSSPDVYIDSLHTIR